MARESYDRWEEDFIALCEDKLEEEPLYPYEHLWKKGLSVKMAFKEYLDENPDYAEKFHETMGTTPPVDAAKSEKEFLERAKLLEAQKKIQEAESKMSKYCPNCARVMGSKKQCKCGYSRNAK